MVVTSIYGAEFVAMKKGIDAVWGIRYKLKIMGVPIWAQHTYGSNISVKYDKLTLEKKCDFICNHQARESVAMRKSWIGLIPHKKTLLISWNNWSVILYMTNMMMSKDNKGKLKLYVLDWIWNEDGNMDVKLKKYC